MKFPNISLGRVSKRYTHNMSFDNNTTLPFGVVQPLLSQRLEPKAKISVNMRQLVRLAPMPVPTFARMYMNNEVSFVPTVDVCPYYEALVSQLSYSNGTKTFYPTELPHTTNSYLVHKLLCDMDSAYYSVYDRNGVLVKDYSVIGNTKIRNEFEKVFYNTVPAESVSYQQEYFLHLKKNFVTCDGADYVVSLLNGGVDNTTEYVFCFRLTERGRRLRSLLLGLGYSLNISDISHVSIIPILSFYKAWFDLYYPSRDLSWTDSNAYKVIKYIEDYNVKFYLLTGMTPYLKVFESFLSDLSQTFYIASDDIVSVHRSTLANGSDYRTPSLSDYDGSHASIVTETGSLPYFSLEYSNSFGLTILQGLQRFTRYVNKNSVIGKRISSYVSAHYGADVANSLFKDSNHIGSFTYPLSVDDVLSQSDTFDNTTKSGELLGAYGGKGIGFDNNHFEFTAPTFGYFFVMSSVSTPTGYYQGNSGDLYVVDFDTVPQPDFDCLGFEVSPRGQFIGYNGIASPIVPSSASLSGGFGFVPRYTGLKYHKNIVSGDLSRRSTASQLSAYHLNRIITPLRITQQPVDTSTDTPRGNIKFDYAPVPSASTEWRYLTKEPWLGNYNRIFYQDIDIYPVNELDPDIFGSDDNFIVQTVFDVKVTDQYKPLSESWDTYEESTDNSSVDVKPE